MHTLIILYGWSGSMFASFQEKSKPRRKTSFHSRVPGFFPCRVLLTADFRQTAEPNSGAVMSKSLSNWGLSQSGLQYPKFHSEYYHLSRFINTHSTAGILPLRQTHFPKVFELLFHAIQKILGGWKEIPFLFGPQSTPTRNEAIPIIQRMCEIILQIFSEFPHKFIERVPKPGWFRYLGRGHHQQHFATSRNLPFQTALQISCCLQTDLCSCVVFKSFWMFTSFMNLFTKHIDFHFASDFFTLSFRVSNTGDNLQLWPSDLKEV